MQGHLIGLMRPKAAASRHTGTHGPAGVMEHRQRILDSLSCHDALSRRGLWGLLAFIVISGLALQLRTVDLFVDLPENVRDILGTAPPPELIHVVLAVSTISSIIIILGRLVDEAQPRSRWSTLWTSVGFRSIFYLFYATANALEENFLIVFAAGVVVLALEHFATWHYAIKAMEREREQLAQIH